MECFKIMDINDAINFICKMYDFYLTDLMFEFKLSGEEKQEELYFFRNGLKSYDIEKDKKRFQNRLEKARIEACKYNLTDDFKKSMNVLRGIQS